MCKAFYSRRKLLQSAVGLLPVARSDAADFPKTAVSCTLRMTDEELSQIEILRSCGISRVDDFCRGEIVNLNALFGVNPRFSFFDDWRGANAWAVNSNPLISDSGQVYFGKLMAKNCLERDDIIADSGGLAIAAVMAHEWAHIAQYSKGYENSWIVRFELGADFLAGWYLAKTRSAETVLKGMFAGMFSEYGSSDFDNPNFHGTASQRLKVFGFGAGCSLQQGCSGTHIDFDDAWRHMASLMDQ